MAMQEFEPSPEEMSSIKRFYNDIENKADSYIDLQIAAEKLLEQEGLGEVGQSYDHMCGILFPSIEQYNADPQTALDRFMMFPLDVIAPWVEMTQSVTDAISWYDRTARQINLFTAKNHRDECYDLSINCIGCRQSEVCPRRYLSQRLQESVSNPNFGSPDYSFDPYRSRELALDKLDIAKDLKIIGYQDYIASASNYTYDFDRRFGDNFR